MAIFSSLNRQQKEAVGLLQIGTFLEYFDLMLYVHMAVLLNELFFPKTDSHAAALLTAFAFCSSYVMRPFGALLFGWIGDNIGRKATVIITTMMMAISCVAMANLPTYDQVGIAAAWIVTLCRIAQGLSSMGEIIGAGIYITEITQPPIRYPMVGLTTFFSTLGGFAALGVATLCSKGEVNWRIAFWIGACIAGIGTLARIRLRETPEFLKSKSHQKSLKANQKTTDPVSIKTMLSLAAMYSSWPLCFYFGYIYCGDILKQQFHYTSAQVIQHNFILSIVHVLSIALFTYLSGLIYPVKLVKIKLFSFIGIALALPYCLYNISSVYGLFTLQALVICLPPDPFPAAPVFIIKFPVLKRFTITSMLYAGSRAIMYIITSFGLVYLTDFFGHFGFLVIMIPVLISFYWGLRHFEKLENQKQHKPQTPHPLSSKLDELKLAE